MIDVLTILILLAFAGGGFLVLRRLMPAQQPMYPPMEMPWRSPYGPKDDYGRIVYPRESSDVPEHQMCRPCYREPRYSRTAHNSEYDSPGYGRPMYGPGYTSQAVMSPWVAGGLGAFGGGLLGYHLGQIAGEQHASEKESGSSDQVTPLDQGVYDPGMIDTGPFDGGFANMDADFGSGDFGTEL